MLNGKNQPVNAHPADKELLIPRLAGYPKVSL
jgi:hypothetical protein